MEPRRYGTRRLKSRGDSHARNSSKYSYDEEKSSRHERRKVSRGRGGEYWPPLGGRHQSPRGCGWEQVIDGEGKVVRFNPRLGLLAPRVRVIISSVFLFVISLALNHHCSDPFAFILYINNRIQLSEASRSQIPQLLRLSGTSYMVKNNKDILYSTLQLYARTNTLVV